MKIKYIIYPVVFLLLTALFSCKKYLDVNRDPNNPSEVTEGLMTSAIISTFSYEVAGGYPTRVTSFWTKHLAYATPGPHEGNYYLVANDVDNFWRYSSYTAIMGTAKELIEKADKNGNPSYAAIGRIIMAWNLAYLTECYGSIPYTDAFKAESGNTKPKYDSQEDIYKQIQALLDQAIIDAGKGTGLKPGTEDFIYGGTMSKWVHLANTLKARYYLRLSNAPGYSAVTQANLALGALNAGSITAAEAPFFQYMAATNSDNPWYQYAIDGKWSTTPRPSQYYVNLLQNSNDPRIAFQVAKVATGANAGKYIGVTNDGPPIAIANYSPIAPFYSARDAKLNLVVYAEVPFIRAEAEFLKAGKVVNAAVISAYNDGIAASMALYGITDYTAYAAANLLTVATPSATAYRMIMTQKYIANYLQFEAYNDFRRTGYPVLPINNEVYDGEDIDIEPYMNIVPLRFPYPSSERSYNAGNIPSDVPINPVNAMQVPLWWDK
ncbi:SusD/RagB family nutrient-binding outer membrane lipoprotein [Pedobacter africanus]|uniref:Starch-binding associating with outer membrane n=1 Tax=Pedobacter africanus TaxID=151894 RepID=A0A1W2BBF2_9SPHI|nr:SusD/RagB family nutrient-binding outer membrane lipoprotein [Pedobacter africanus]SMC70353.1 Starch-binding associating with outer membrane [Pedobacter africanus]